MTPSLFRGLLDGACAKEVMLEVLLLQQLGRFNWGAGN